MKLPENSVNASFLWMKIKTVSIDSLQSFSVSMASQERERSTQSGWESCNVILWLLVNIEITSGKDLTWIYQVLARFGVIDMSRVRIIQKLVEL